MIFQHKKNEKGMSEMKKLVRRPSAIAIAIRAWLLVLGALAANADGFSVVEPAAGRPCAKRWS